MSISPSWPFRPRFVSAAIEDLGRKGVPAVSCSSFRLRRAGAAGARLFERAQGPARGSGSRGPNCLGVVNAFDRVMASFGQYGGLTPPGPVAFVTQSGAFGTSLPRSPVGAIWGLGYFSSIPATRSTSPSPGHARGVVRCPHPRRLRLHRGLRGRSRSSFASPNRRSRSASGWCSPRWAEPHGGRAAISLTGSLAGEDRVFAGIARQFGIVRARNEEHMSLDLVEVFTFCDCWWAMAFGS